ncbi:dihydrofolate reductase [Mesorhizobium sp. NBSH29]|uniref:dihydrofolate reductase family protein n=1 Tax=Mesorhizobium sp. NBSH29 TaxID=2654249 RepID=UPI0018968AE0|nr:dihydrofolate reductase family protein [Mesorhizobium sp. NBSH29]QPC86586.1 dihydrofolate reductase [Mesorhizobium sp. NBSH29]
MRKLIAWNVMTLDGYFEGTGPWQLDMHGTVWGEELEEFSLAQGAEIGTLLFGRRTYEGMRDHWTKEEGPVATMMNSLDKAIASRTLDVADWANSRLLKGEAIDTVKALKQEDGKDVFVFGSADLLATLMAEGLVDEYRICLAPVVWGEGTPLFKPESGRAHFSLRESQPLKSGGMLLFYELKKV